MDFVKSEVAAYTVAENLAPLLGGELLPRDGDQWRGRVMLPNGLQIIVEKPYGSKGVIWAYLSRPGYPGQSVKCGGIGADLTRPADKLAADIKRRLLPTAEAAAQKARDAWAALEHTHDALKAMAADFSAMPGVTAKIENANQPDQRVRVRLGASLVATVYPSGSIYVDSMSFSGPGGRTETAPAERLKAVIAALS
jgi:hypothetical protein